MLGLDVLISVANVIYLFSYSVRDILWLRILTVLGASILIPYYYFQPDPLMAAIAWNIVFIVINLIWIVKLVADRRPVQFSDEERQLYETALQHVSEHDAIRLLRRATWSSEATGTTLVSEGTSPESLMLIADGNVDVQMEGTLVDKLATGRFLGAAAFLARNTDFEAPVTITTTEPTRIATWSIDDLAAQVEDDLRLKVALEARLGLELARFLQTSRSEFVRLKLA
jgi:hypothetical protein